LLLLMNSAKQWNVLTPLLPAGGGLSWQQQQQQQQQQPEIRVQPPPLAVTC
jgi:hypothetical protein